MYRFVEVFLGSQSRKVKTIAFLVMSLGAGTGWLASLFGRATADLWVPEAFPFLAMSTNPHFPLGLAILLGFLIQIRLPYRRYYPILLIIEGIVAAITMQFIVPVGAAIAGALQLYEVIKKLHPIRWWMLWFFVPAGLILVYQIVSMNSDPVLAGWSAQNVTPAPPFWDVLVSFSPMFLFALGSIVWLVKTKNVNGNRLLVVWLIIGMFLPYVPYQLQRRLSTAYFIPVAGLAALSIGLLLNHSRKIVRMGTLLVVGTAFLTNVFILISGTMAIQRHAPEIYYPKNVKVAFDWMLQNRMSDNLTLSAPETGSYIPGATGWRVVYGHPLETPNSEQTLAEVEMIFNGSYGQAEISHYLLEKDVRYVFVGPFEREYLGDLGWIKNYPVIYQNPDVTIIRTGAAE
jgi:hypothetical protein